MKTAFGLLIGLALIAGCDKPAGGSKGSPVIESWNPPKDSTNVVLLYSSSADRTGYKFEVPKAMVERLPDWDPNSNTIPLLPQQAAQLALARYRALHPLFTNLQASSIFLQEISWYRTKWAYHVYLVPRDEAGRFAEPKDSIRIMVVLLDGTVVDPVINPDAKLPLATTR